MESQQNLVLQVAVEAFVCSRNNRCLLCGIVLCILPFSKKKDTKTRIDNMHPGKGPAIALARQRVFSEGGRPTLRNVACVVLSRNIAAGDHGHCAGGNRRASLQDGRHAGSAARFRDDPSLAKQPLDSVSNRRLVHGDEIVHKRLGVCEGEIARLQRQQAIGNAGRALEPDQASCRARRRHLGRAHRFYPDDAHGRDRSL